PQTVREACRVLDVREQEGHDASRKRAGFALASSEFGARADVHHLARDESDRDDPVFLGGS
ncbi:hypothetical protein, partial [Klebsiella pneumoniae]|uniref:hypothetical protein n=1 Tax=Klebsiella pneumoniae TaxID=573 RepID=UPI003013916E